MSSTAGPAQTTQNKQNSDSTTNPATDGATAAQASGSIPAGYMLVPVPVSAAGGASVSVSLNPDSAHADQHGANLHAVPSAAHYSITPGQPYAPYYMQHHVAAPGFAPAPHHAPALHPASQAAAAGVHHAYGLPGYAPAPGLAASMHMQHPHAHLAMYPQQFPVHGMGAPHGYHPAASHMHSTGQAAVAAHAIALATAGTPQAYVPGTAPAIGTVLTEFPVQKPGPALQFGSDPQGPQGANLFIFHLPNDMTNMDLLHYFAPFGTVVSARIIVDRATGRSRGFGFVSYSRPEYAAAAIQRLDGMRIGHKRLKVTLKHEKGAGGGGPKGQQHVEQPEPERNDPAPEEYAGTPFTPGAAGGGPAAELPAPTAGNSDVDPETSISSHGRAGSPHASGAPPGGEASAPAEPKPASGHAAAAAAAAAQGKAAQGGRERRKRPNRKRGSSSKAP